MGVLPIVLLILAMKIPIFGLLAFVWWAARQADAEDGQGERVEHEFRPRRPGPARRRGPRRRGPHGGAAAQPSPPRMRGPAPVRASSKR